MAGTEKARELRRLETPAERWLWQHVRGRRFGGAKFRRQHPLGPYFVDLYCASHRLAVEIDGGHHLNPDDREYDAVRTEFMAARAVRTIRFTNHEVLHDTATVLARIAAALEE